MGVNAHLYQSLSVGRLLHYAAEVAGELKGAEIYIAAGLGGVPVQNKVGIMIVAGDTPAVFNNYLAVAQLLGEALLLSSPMAVDIGEVQILIERAALSPRAGRQEIFRR